MDVPAVAYVSICTSGYGVKHQRLLHISVCLPHGIGASYKGSQKLKPPVDKHVPMQILMTAKGLQSKIYVVVFLFCVLSHSTSQSQLPLPPILLPSSLSPLLHIYSPAESRPHRVINLTQHNK